MEFTNIEDIISKKKKERTLEEQKIFDKYKKSQWNKNYNSKKQTKQTKQHNFKQNSITDDISEISDNDDKNDNIDPELLEEYVQYRLELIKKEEEKPKQTQETKEDNNNTTYQESFLEQIARSTILQVTQMMVPVGLATIFGLYSNFTTQSANTSTAQSAQQQTLSDPFSGTLGG